MTQEEEQVIAKVLDPEKFRQVPKSPVVDVRWHDYVDWEGVPALRVWVILKKSVTNEQILAGRLQPVRRAIHDGLLDAGVKLHPYIRYRVQSDLDKLGGKV
jgi:hypothetical protein